MNCSSSNPHEIDRDSLGWDVVNWSAALRLWEQEIGEVIAGSRALEVGAGKNNGGLSLWLASRGCTVISSNLGAISPAVVACHERHGVSSRISYEVIDALAVPYREAFDIVVFKSVLGGVGAVGGLDAQRKAVVQMLRALRPGGALLFAENLVSTPLHRALRRRFGAGRASWRYLTLEEIRSLMTPFESLRIETGGLLGAFGRTEGQRNILAAVDRIVCRILPRRWHYIAMGVARKAESNRGTES